jgi:hypothetical protein
MPAGIEVISMVGDTQVAILGDRLEHTIPNSKQIECYRLLKSKLR